MSEVFELIPSLDTSSITLKAKKELSDKDLSLYLEGLKIVVNSLVISITNTENSILIAFKKGSAGNISQYSKLFEKIINKWEGFFYEERPTENEILLKGNLISFLRKIQVLYPDLITYVTTNLLEVEKTEGIEEARRRILLILNKVFEDQNAKISYRYLSLLVDTMSREGELKPLSRTGIISGKDSFLAKAAFESTVPIFVTSSTVNKKDELRGVIERILLNKEVSLFS